MTMVKIEQLGGIAGIGDSFSALQRTAEVDLATLAQAQKNEVDDLFGRPAPKDRGADRIQFQLTRMSNGVIEEVVVKEDDLPSFLQSALSFQFR